MKHSKNNYSRYTICIFLAILDFVVISCGDLELQEDFEYNPEVPDLFTFEDMTAWELINDTTIVGREFDSMIVAIEHAGMVDFFNTASHTRTFFILGNDTFDDEDGRLQQDLTDRTPGSSILDIDPTRLRNLILYHIIDEEVGQFDLPRFDIDFPFQTMLDDPIDGLMTINRDNRFRMRINDREGQLTSTKREERVWRHSYIVSNGIVHFLEDDYVRNTPF